MFGVVGLGAERTAVTLTADTVRVHAWMFDVEIPVRDIAAVGDANAPWWALAGIHTDTKGHWIVNGASGPMVRLDLSTPATARFAGMNVRVRRLDIGIDDDERFRRELAGARER